MAAQSAEVGPSCWDAFLMNGVSKGADDVSDGSFTGQAEARESTEPRNKARRGQVGR